MSNLDFDLKRLADIPDPFGEVLARPPSQVGPKPLTHAPARSRVRRLRYVAAAAAIVYDASWPALVKTRPDIRTASPTELAWGLAVPLVVCALALSISGRSGDRGLGEPKARLATWVIASPLLFAVATLLVAPGAFGDRFWLHAMGCAFVTVILATGPLAIGVLAFRRAFAAASRLRAAALGVASGALAAATMSIVCPIGNAGHVLVGHGAILVFAGAAGGLLGRRFCRS